MIERIPFGSTGHDSTRVIFGAAALGSATEREADEALELLLDRGDQPHRHRRELRRLGAPSRTVVPGASEPVFPCHEDGRAVLYSPREEIRRSLERMGVDQVDLIQLHCLVHPAEWDLAMSEEGALRAAIEARDEGLVRFIGVTGHGLTVAEMHRRSLKRFSFDSVLFPFSHVIMQDTQYAPDVEQVLTTCRARNIAVQTIKGIARGPWGSKEPTAGTWYEPLHEQAHIDLAVHWILGEPGVFLNGPSDIELLARVIDAAERFTARPDEAAMAELAEEQRLSTMFV